MENEQNLVPNSSNAVANVPTLEQRVLKIQFHLQNMGQSAIIIGQELIECKKEVPHGDWLNWLEKNFHLKERSARNFMEIAERFGNSSNSQFRQSIADLGYTQMVQMLALPAGEEEDFIEEKAAEGTPVEDMTVKKLRDEIKNWKQKADELSAENDDLQEKVARHDEITDSNARAYNQLVMDYNELQSKKTIEVLPPDYETNKRKILELQMQIAELQEKLSSTPVEIIPEDEDYDDAENQFDDFQDSLEHLNVKDATSQALSHFFTMTNFLHEHKDILNQVLNNYKSFSPLISKNVNQIADISNIFKNFLGNISK